MCRPAGLLLKQMRASINGAAWATKSRYFGSMAPSKLIYSYQQENIWDGEYQLIFWLKKFCGAILKRNGLSGVGMIIGLILQRGLDILALNAGAILPQMGRATLV